MSDRSSLVDSLVTQPLGRLGDSVPFALIVGPVVGVLTALWGEMYVVVLTLRKAAGGAWELAIRTEYRYRVSLVRTADSAVESSATTPTLASYELDCPS